MPTPFAVGWAAVTLGCLLRGLRTEQDCAISPVSYRKYRRHFIAHTAKTRIAIIALSAFAISVAGAAVIVVAGGTEGTPAPAGDNGTTLHIVPPVAPLQVVPAAEPVGPVATDNGPAAQPQVVIPPVKTVVVTAPVAAPVVVPPVAVPPVVPPVVVPPVVVPPKPNPFPIEQVKPGAQSPASNPFPAGGGPKTQPQQPASPGGASTGGTSVGP